MLCILHHYFVTIMKRIPLSQHGKYKGRFFAIVDDEDFDRVSSIRWYIMRNRKFGNYYSRALIDGKTTLMHRLILNAPRDVQVDHRDHNGLNNTRSNLRFATPSQNSGNQSGWRNRKNSYKGVSINRRKWRAILCGKPIGTFDTPEAAALAYDRAAIERWGEFARTNFPAAQKEHEGLSA